jgi:hypothetical protein
LLTQIFEALSSRRIVQIIGDVLLAALRLIPGLIVILLSSLAFVVFPFVGETKQRGTLELVDRLIRWTVYGDLRVAQELAPITDERGDQVPQIT